MTSDKARNTEARMNTMIPYTYSTLNTHTTQIATANTNITTNTTSITGLNSRLGSNAQQTFLGSLQQASLPGSASHSGVGTLGSAPTASEFNALNTAYNNTADLINLLMIRLGATNIMH